jgi:DNA mismatch endonuclease (patch repair protein)
MIDIVSPDKRSEMMSGIRTKNTNPEIIVRKILFSTGLRFRLHRRDLPGVPDIVLPRHRVAIFVHGCFWHMHTGCRLAKMPQSNASFWKKKLEGNRERDQKNVHQLVDLGWRVLVVWECSTKNDTLLRKLADDMNAWLSCDEKTAEIPDLPT